MQARSGVQLRGLVGLGLLAVAIVGIESSSALAINVAAGGTPNFYADDRYEVAIQPNYVTRSNPPNGGDRATTPGVLAHGVNMDGVGRMFIDNVAALGAGSLCSCSLLGDGQTVLTAAHCVSNASGVKNVIDGVDGNTVTFELSSGNVIRSFAAADVAIHPAFDGNIGHGNDVAVIKLSSAATGVPTYPLFPTSSLGNEIGAASVKVGYGLSGFGTTGVNSGLFPGGAKRAGLNEYENIGLVVPGITNLATQLTYDFDNGLAANDAFGFFFGTTGPLGGSGNAAFNDANGFGLDEVASAPGDSGGPTFVLDGGVFKIAGVTSYGFRVAFQGGATADIDSIGSQPDASFGEFAVDARVANPAIQSFIVGQLAIPEPSGIVLLFVGMATFLRVRGRA